PARLKTLGLAPERDLDIVEESGQSVVGLDRRAPRPGERAHGVHGHDPGADPALLQPPREVELGDVATEEVLEVDGRYQDVDARRGVVAEGELERCDLLGERQGRVRVRDPNARLLCEVWRGYRVEPQASLRPVPDRRGEQTAP